LALALRLRDDAPVGLRVMALVALLVTPGTSPFDPNRRLGVREAVGSALSTLDPPSRAPARVRLAAAT
jgi:hypothetical protein